jgi:hypothetical protein
MAKRSTSISSKVKVSKTTRERVERRLALANLPYKAHRHDFSPRWVKRLRAGRMVGKALLVWTTN